MKRRRKCHVRLAECDACAVCIPIPMALVRRASVSDGNMNITRPVDRIRRRACSPVSVMIGDDVVCGKGKLHFSHSQRARRGANAPPTRFSAYHSILCEHACLHGRGARPCRTLPAAVVRRASSALGPTHGLVPCLRDASLSRGWEAEDAKRAIISAYTVFVVGSVG